MEFNLYLREVIFVTDVAVLTIETTKLVFKPLDIFWRFWNTRKRYVCEKGNIDGRERGCRQSLQRGTKIFWRRRWKTYKRFCTSTQKHLVLWTTSKALEPWWRNYKFEVGYNHEKTDCPVTNTFMPLSALSTMSPPSVQTVRDLDR